MIYSYCEQWNNLELYEDLMAQRVTIGPRQSPRCYSRCREQRPTIIAVPNDSKYFALQIVRPFDNNYLLEIEDISQSFSMIQHNDYLYIFGRTNDKEDRTKVFFLLNIYNY